MTGEDLPRTGTTRILEKAFSMLIEATPRPGRVADLPCGTGYLSVRAARAGWEVHPFDLFPELWEGPPEIEVERADLNHPLPIETDRFDALLCCEGFEHIENPWLVLREFRRVVRPGGIVVISMPNTIDLRQRFRMLRLGFFTHYLPSVPGHINLMGAFALCHALLGFGYRIRGIGSPKVYGGAGFRALSKLFAYRRRSRLPDDVRRMLSSPDILCSRTVVVCAEVTPETRPARPAGDTIPHHER